MLAGSNTPPYEALRFKRISNFLYISLPAVAIILGFVTYEMWVMTLNLKELNSTFSTNINAKDLISNPSPVDRFITSNLLSYELLELRIIFLTFYALMFFILSIMILVLHNFFFERFLQLMGLNTLTQHNELDISWDYVQRKVAIRKGIIPLKLVEIERVFWEILRIDGH